jgi:DNA-binding LacI/PurR family transcriptional regulator
VKTVDKDVNPLGVGWRQVCDQLRQDIATGRFAPGERMPSEADLTRRFGASKLTVHRALRELANEGIVRRVERVGTFVAERDENAAYRIALILPAAEGFLEIKYLAGIREVLGARHPISLYATDNDSVIESEVVAEAAEGADGILILPTCHPRVTKRLERIQEDGCPVVCLDRRPFGSCLPGVSSDNYTATWQALERLYAVGHRRISYFGFYSSTMSSVRERFQAYTDFLAQYGLGEPFDQARFIDPRPFEESHVPLRIFRDAVATLSAADEPFTAAFCMNEFFLNVLLEVCQALPLATRSQLEVTSFNDWPHLNFPNVRTHVIRQDAREIGRTSARLLLAALRDPSTPAQSIEVPATYVEFLERPGAPLGRLATIPDAAT